MTVEVIDCEQRTEAWYLARLGRPTASQFSAVMASGRKGDPESVMRRAYLYKLASEVITGRPSEDGWRGAAMERGIAEEDGLRRDYEMLADADVTRVGFMVNGRVGCSPDGLVGDDGMLEIKSERQDLLLDRHLNGGSPINMAQLQGALMVAEREWIDQAIGSPGMRLWRRRIRRDEAFISRLRLGLSVFIEELDELVEKYRRLA